MGAYRIPIGLAEVTDWPALALDCGYSVTAIARLLGVSQHEVRSFCRHQVGCTTKRWLMDLRVAQAETFLEKELPVEHVAQRLGYGDAIHFCHDFKRARGLCPTRWRALRRDRPQLVTAKPVRLPRPRVRPTDFDFPWLSREGYI